eukprot:SAG22_NODE_2682_length_2312_cov_234.180298_2_plen_87_part_00
MLTPEWRRRRFKETSDTAIKVFDTDERFTSNLQKLRADRELDIVTLLAGGKTIHGHRVVLAASRQRRGQFDQDTGGSPLPSSVRNT